MRLSITGPAGLAILAAAFGTLAFVAPSHAAKEVKWAAIYYEWQTGKYGSARPFERRRDALKAAFNAAIANGANPKRYRHQSWAVRRGCIYVFKELDGFHWGVGAHSNEKIARRVAQRRCERSGRRCRVRVSVCSESGF